MSSRDRSGRIEFIVAVTGHAETHCVPRMLRKTFPVTHSIEMNEVRRVHQRPRVRPRGKRIAVPQAIPDHERLVRELSKILGKGSRVYFLWIDDLENDRPTAIDQFRYYQQLLDREFTGEYRRRCSVHFLVNMLEAYYFADEDAINAALALGLRSHGGDCENIKHPKSELKGHIKQQDPSSAFHERDHGAMVVQQLNMDTVLGNSQTCRSLRTLVAWCWEAIGEARTERFRLNDGVYWDVTVDQLQQRPPDTQIGPLGNEEPYRPGA